MLIYKREPFYGNSPSSERNANVVTGATVDGQSFKVYFSYETPIAVRIDGVLTIAENTWGMTTGKHLNAICRDKTIRVEHSKVLEAIKTLTATLPGNPSMKLDAYTGNSAGAQSKSLAVYVGQDKFYFSFETLIGVSVGWNVVLRENIWGPTTGKHLSSIADKSKRVSEEAFKHFTETLYIPSAARDVFVF